MTCKMENGDASPPSPPPVPKVGVAVKMENGAESPSSPPPVQKIAVAVFLLNGNKVLLRRRISSSGNNSFALPGGELEFGESFEECAVREVKEETGLDIETTEIYTVVNNVIAENVQVVCILLRAILVDPAQVLQNLEPEESGGWEWYDWNELPKPLFGPFEEVLPYRLKPFS
ncbi:PREDICTED: nudix hydrolase 1-like isoform X1 [Ipomoea nil]|uniref:nudix hydrolase 1-like isoform X1 n=1 Tax=Ipomoea nil TaxID=35883 RepID=UPI0009010D6C|nr:PREDICTED: nudix hydrolase 1-like isoform X1 [Ipomoea nil]